MDPHLAQYEFFLGTVANITATQGDNMVADPGYEWTSMAGGTVTNTNTGSAYIGESGPWEGVVSITIKNCTPTSISGYPSIFHSTTGGGGYAAIYPNGSVVLQLGSDFYTIAPMGSLVAGTPTDLVLTMPMAIDINGFYAVVGSFGELIFDAAEVPEGAMDPADMTVVYNTDDSEGADMATDYAAAYGIPSGNIISIALGTDDACDATQAAALYSAIEAAGKQATQLCMRFPSRTESGQSITSVATFGIRTTSDLTESELYGHTSLKPYTDYGRRPSAILLSSSYRKDGVVLNSGTSYLTLSKDGLPTNIRGSARASQTAPGLVVWDARSNGSVGEGSNSCNQLSTTCGAPGYPTIGDVAAGYQSGYILVDDGGVSFLNGFYGDHMTSYGGNLPDGYGSQTPLTYHLDRGASFSVGTVEEPGEYHAGYSYSSAVEQMVDVSIFDPLFRANVPVGISAWASVLCPDRALFAGDFMFRAQFP